MDIRSIDGGVSFAVRVQPGASLEGIVGNYGDAVKIALQAPAVDGKANDALVRYLAGLLGVPRMSVTIASGTISRSKVVHVLGIAQEEAAARLKAIPKPAAAVTRSE